MSQRSCRRLIISIASILLLAYAVSYLVVTQGRYEQFRGWNARGFWYASWKNEPSESWERKERTCGTFYGPLHFIEYDLLGMGMPHAACSPFFGLGK